MLPLGSGKRGGVGVTAGLGVAGSGVRVGVTRGAVGVGEGGTGVKVGGTVGEGGMRVAVGGGGGRVIVGVGTRVGVGGALHPSTSTTSTVSARQVNNFPFTKSSPFTVFPKHLTGNRRRCSPRLGGMVNIRADATASVPETIA